MPVDTLADSLFPLSILERILNGREKDGTIKVKRTQMKSMMPMLIEYE